MEQELNEFKNNDNNDYFKVDYKNQDVSKIPGFKSWYERTDKYIKNENIARGKAHDIYNDHILLIAFCDTCISYVICSYEGDFSYIKCTKCQTYFCIGCSRKQKRFNKYHGDETLCIKGYLKLFYLRTIYRRAELIRTHPKFHILHIFFCLFITPLYLGFISNVMGFLFHPKKEIEKDELEKKFSCIFLYSIFRGILMFPYIILFLPFMIILLLPGIFSYKYYLYIYIMYITAIWPGTGSLENVGDN